jgi:GT2 family glycosyltransferase
MTRKIDREGYHGKTLQSGALSRSRSHRATGLSRLIRHTTTIDPFLDESGPSARRLGPLMLDGESFDAFDLSAPPELTVEIRTAARSILRVPCAATGSAPGDVVFEVEATAADDAPRRRRLRISTGGSARWHVLALRVPAGSLTVTIRATGSGDLGAVCGVPSLTWRKSPRAISRSLAFAVRTLGVPGALRYARTKLGADTAAQYAAWRAHHALTAEALQSEGADAAAMTVRPRFALCVEVPAGSDPKQLEATLASLEAQVYADWEVWRAVDTVGRNAALEQSNADFIGALRAGDRLSPLALLRAAQRIAAADDVDVLYTDEDVWVLGGEPSCPAFKPDWSPELLQACMYVGRLLLVRRSLAASLGGYRPAMHDALDYDLALRACAVARRVEHVSDVLYHRGAAASGYADSAAPAAGAAIADACAGAGLAVTVVPGAMSGVWRPRITLSERPRVTVVIPTDGRAPAGATPTFIEHCVRSLRERTRYPVYDLLVCDNGNLDAATTAYLDSVPHRRVTYRWTGGFNFARKMNFAVRQTDAPFVLLLNDDIEPINAEWLDAMLEYAHQAQIGAVGAKLFYPDGRLQHVGAAVGVCGVVAHLLHQHPGGTLGCGGIAVTIRNCSAVTGACLLTRRQVYDEVGGFDEGLALDFNDVAFCLGVRRAGYRIVFTPYARLFHHESGSFGARRQSAEEVAAMREKWGPALERDPYYNVNLSREFPDCRIRSCK